MLDHATGKLDMKAEAEAVICGHQALFRHQKAIQTSAHTNFANKFCVVVGFCNILAMAFSP